MQEKPPFLAVKQLDTLDFHSYDPVSGDRIGEEDANRWAIMTAMAKNLAKRSKPFYNKVYTAEELEGWEEWQVNYNFLFYFFCCLN